jgi:hypothetical protein
MFCFGYFFFFKCVGLRYCQLLRYYSVGNRWTYEHGALMENQVFLEKPVPVSPCPLQDRPEIEPERPRWEVGD